MQRPTLLFQGTDAFIDPGYWSWEWTHLPETLNGQPTQKTLGGTKFHNPDFHTISGTTTTELRALLELALPDRSEYDPPFNPKNANTDENGYAKNTKIAELQQTLNGQIKDVTQQAMRTTTKPKDKHDIQTRFNEKSEQSDYPAARALLGAFTDPTQEYKLMSKLSDLLICDTLRKQLITLTETTRKTNPNAIALNLRIIPATGWYSLPWELLVVVPNATPGDDWYNIRLLDIADIEYPAPPTSRDAQPEKPTTWADHHTKQKLYVIDPDLPHHGFVLPAAHKKWIKKIKQNNTTSTGFVGKKVDRWDLAAILNRDPHIFHERNRTRCTKNINNAAVGAPVFPETPPQQCPWTSFLYVGHVGNLGDTVSATEYRGLKQSNQATTALMLSPTTHDSVGLTARQAFQGTLEFQDGQIFTAKELKETTLWDAKDVMPTARPKIGSEIWPIPPRVAMVACGSGTDLSGAEPFGLATAFIEAGAELVIATRWTIPTDYAINLLAYKDCSRTEELSPLANIVEKVDEWLDHSNPIAAWNEWAREQLTAWKNTTPTPEPANLARTPLLWASMTIFNAPHRYVGEAPPPPENTGNRK